ncbi:unnamed protein product [Darwinula stevensoni]|nr:unnamed protein product [Darwinula stevensoni]CAG0882527.1 unnamed protein product [Darwinula stevensoni]
MERRDVVLTAVLATLACLLSLLGAMAFFCWCRWKKGLNIFGWGSGKTCSSTDPDAEALHGILTPGPGHSPGKIEGQITTQPNGAINVKTPLIKTKAFNQMAVTKPQLLMSSAATSTAAAVMDANAKPPNNTKPEHPAMAFWQNRSMSLVDMYVDSSEPTETVGHIQFSLEYDFATSTLILKIIQGKDLPAKDLSGTSDPYVRVTLLPDKKHRLETKIRRRTLNPRWNETFYFEDPYVKVWLQYGDKRVEKRKTPVYKCTLNPTFNESFAFNVPWERIREAALNVLVMDFDSVGRNELIGKLVLASKNTTGVSETKHWQDMICKSRQTVTQWHRLKPE